MPRLRAVKPDETAPATPTAKPPTIVEAAKSGDHLALLKAMRDRLAITIQHPDCPPRDLAALTRRLDDIAKQIKAAEVEAEQEAMENAEASGPEAWDADAI